jgi:hypothetical protein
LVWGDTVYAKVSATNVKGTSLVSLVGSGGNVADSPDIPISFASTASTSATLIGLSWSPGPTWYGLDVQDYAVSYDKGLGDGSVHLLEDGIIETAYTFTPVVQGNTYVFYIQSRSDYGFSSYSDPISIVAA